MSITVTVTCGDTPIELTGTLTKEYPATHVQPAEGGEFEIEGVSIGGICCYELWWALKEETRNNLENEAAEKARSQAEGDAEDAAEARREWYREMQDAA